MPFEKLPELSGIIFLDVYSLLTYYCTMIRVNHFLPEPQVKALKALAKKTGLSVAELLRKAVEMFLRSESGK